MNDNINAQQAFVKSGLHSAAGTRIIELKDGILAYCFSEKGFSLGGEVKNNRF